MDSDQRRPRAHKSIRFVLATLVTLLATAVLNPLSALAKPPVDGSGYARIKSVCGAPEPGDASCFALVRQPAAVAEASDRGVHKLKLSDGAAAGPAGGLTPSDLASAYGYEPSVGGSGQTLAIVDAFDDPNIESDLGEFDSHYGLPVCTAANKCFEKVNQEGSAAPLPGADETGWSAEIALDVESAHATCQKCTILLVEARSNSLANLAAGVHEAVALGADEVSNSYGGPEGGTFGEAADYSDPDRVILAASGDWGYNGWLAPEEFPEAPNLPSSLPSVVSVGGTTLTLDETGKRLTETVWNGNGPENEFEFEEGASGGGCSLSWSAPPWQQSTDSFAATGCGSKRSAVDVSADADPLTGFDIFDSDDCGKRCEEFRRGKSWITLGGTSLSTPLVAGMYALAGGSNGISNPALTLYGHQGDSSLFDVRQGGNGFCDDNGAACGIDGELEEFLEEPFRIDCEGTTACNATTGFDGPSGVGAPSSLGLFKPAIPVGAITPPAKAVAGAPAGFSAAATSDPYPGAGVTASYAWSWGDGTESSGQTPTHTFALSGEYTVTMTYTDRYGLKAAPVSVKVAVAERTAKETEEAATKKKAEEEAAAKRKAEEETAKKKAEEEAKTKSEQEALGKKAAEEQAGRLVEESARARAAEEAARRAAESHAASGQGVAVFKSSADPDVTLAGLSLNASASGAFTLKISCPVGETSCEGTVTVRTAAAVPASARVRILALAVASFKLAGGKTAIVKLHLNARARALLGRRHRLRVKVTIAAHDPAGASHSSVATATLRRRG
jgi:PKD repeat protein